MNAIEPISMKTFGKLSHYEAQTIRLLEFDKVLSLVKGFCISDLGRDLLERNCLSNEERAIHRNYTRLAEYEFLRKLDSIFTIHSILDCAEIIRKIDIENYFIELSDLHLLRNMCTNVREIKEYFSQTTQREELRHLIEFVQIVFYNNTMEREISKILDEDGQMRADASPELKRITERKKSIQSTIDKSFHAAFQRAKSSGYLHEIGESIRQGRRVLAVLAESKRSVKGIIIDESETGRISFIEPSETIFLSNEAFEIEREEHREIRRILIATTKVLSQYKTLFQVYQEFMAEWDMIQAKNQFSHLIEGSIPRISNKLKLNKAFHPLLKIKNDTERKAVVPFDLSLRDYRMLMISGPNAGGKSITLKTIGLIAYMVKSSIPIPAEGDSEFPIFEQVIGDIGDLQSLEDELSTYSSKLTLWKHIMKVVTPQSLILFDELGGGTDPSFGASMAQAVLENCLDRKSTIVATTHYSDLKKLADERTDILNGSMLFDEVKLEPIFKLVLDKPGSSYTFHIAKKIGIPDQVIQRAESLSHTDQVNYEKQLLRLEKKEKELHFRLKELEQKERELKKQMKDWNRLHLDLDVTRKKIKYEKMLHNQEADQVKSKELHEFKTNLKQKKLEELAEEQRIINEKILREKEESNKLFREIHRIKPNHEFKEGDTVQYIQTNTKGVIDKIQKNKAVVIFDNIKSTLSLKDLIPVEKEEKKKLATKRILASDSIHLRELDLRGKFVYEALPELEDFINKSLMSNFHEVKIIHGKGKLKSEILKVLQKHRSVSKVSHALPEHGGDGVTNVFF